MDKGLINGMLLARESARSSRCQRRRIGAVVHTYKTYYIGYNSPAIVCKECTRLKGVCPAVHAEVSAITMCLRQSHRDIIAELFVWSEIPCLQCLSFIHQTGLIYNIYCLTPESYQVEYPHLCYEDIERRRVFAADLGILVHELDREYLLDQGGIYVVPGNTNAQHSTVHTPGQ